MWLHTLGLLNIIPASLFTRIDKNSDSMQFSYSICSHGEGAEQTCTFIE
jgi:hypothetical protein